MSFSQKTYLCRYRFRDNDGAESTCEVQLHPEESVGAALSFCGLLRPIIQALSDAVCIEADLFVRWHQITTSVLASNTLDQGTFIFNTDVPDLAIIRIPSIKTSVLESSGPYEGIRIDQSHTDVATFVAAVTGGIGIESASALGDDLVTLAEAFRELL